MIFKLDGHASASCSIPGIVAKPASVCRNRYRRGMSASIAQARGDSTPILVTGAAGAVGEPLHDDVSQMHRDHVKRVSLARDGEQLDGDTRRVLWQAGA